MNDQPKTTAHQLWCIRLQSQMEEILKKVLQFSGHRTSRTEVKKITSHAIYTAIQFENFRLRIHVDEMIILLDASKAECEKIKKEYEAINPLLFWKKFNKKLVFFGARGMQEAYQNAVRLMVNTPPPPGDTTIVDPQEKMPVPELTPDEKKALDDLISGRNPLKVVR